MIFVHGQTRIINKILISLLFSIITSCIYFVSFVYAPSDTTPPQWANQTTNVSTNIINQINAINLSAQGKDETALDWAWLSTNETGSWANYTSGIYVSSEWWNNSFTRKVPITVNTNPSLTNYALQINITYDSDMQSNFNDIRFTNASENQQLPYWIDNKVDGNWADVWILGNFSNQNGTQLYMYYGNSTIGNESNEWYNLKHLNIQNGVFNYNASLGVNGYSSQTMQHRIGISAGGYHTCVLKSNGNTACWGSNSNGQAKNYTSGDAIAISAGDYYGHYTCVLKSNGNTACWGYNSYGEANNYTGGDAIAISAGGYHTCVLKSNGNTACYGYNGYGEANNYTGGDAIAISASGDDHTCVLKSNGNTACWGDNSFGQANNYTSGDAIAIILGESHTCVLKSNGNTACWGSNSNGQANNYTGGDAIAISAGNYHTCVLKSNGNTACWGSNSFGQANNYTGGDAIAISIGDSRTCVLKSNGNTACWGYNGYGEANNYTGGDGKNPFRNYVSVSPTTSIGSEQYQQSFSSLYYNSPMNMAKDSNWQWSNFTWQNSSVSQGNIIGWRIYYNDTSNNQNATDIMTFGIQKSTLEVNLSEPSTEIPSNIIQNHLFTVNATVFCRGGSCDYINGTIFYNLTSEYPDTAINTSFGDKPFFINESGPLAMKSCPTNPLDKDEFCNLTWVINASGNTNTDWKIGVIFNSSTQGIQPNSTNNATVSIIPCPLDFGISWNYIQFGNTQLDPNTFNNSAIGNTNNQYNITVNYGSCNSDLYIRGDDLTNQTYNSVIKVGNISWSNISSNINNGYFQLSSINSPVKLNVPESTNVTTWYWLNVPPTYSGYYNSTIYITGVKNGESP
jgi:hypothetical protein